MAKKIKKNKHNIDDQQENAHSGIIEGIYKQNNSIAVATRYAKNVMANSSYFVDQNVDNPLYELAIHYVPEKDEILSPSWDRRKGNGALYG